MRARCSVNLMTYIKFDEESKMFRPQFFVCSNNYEIKSVTCLWILLHVTKVLGYYKHWIRHVHFTKKRATQQRNKVYFIVVGETRFFFFLAMVIYCPSYTTQWCTVMQQLTKLHVSTPWGHLQDYKIWYHTRYINWYYLRDPVVYSILVITCGK